MKRTCCNSSEGEAHVSCPLIKRLLADLDAECFPTPEQPRGYRMVEDRNGYPCPIYDAPPITHGDLT